jgi:prepilin-type N-terminal cleavage/methylation domain-containing protein
MVKHSINGFTLVEVIMVMVICGVLAAIAVPKFISFRQEAILAAEKQVVSNVKIGVNSYYIESVTNGRTPLNVPVLDDATNTFASKDNPFFTFVLQSPGVIGSGWRKVIANAYQGPSGLFYFYDSSAGRFLERVVLSDDILQLLQLRAEDITADILNQLNSQNPITFSNGRTLIGGSAVLTPRSGREPTLSGTDTRQETFSYFSSTVTAKIAGEYAGYASRINVGYYTVDPLTGQKTLHQIFSGPDATGAQNSFTVAPGQVVGFYFTTPQGAGYTYYSQIGSNPDGKEHIKVYQNEGVRTITLGLEDLYGGGDGDFQDMIITVSY